MTHHHHHHRGHFWHLWGWPIALGLLTVFGLISALFSDGGLGDVLAWFALGIPVAVGIWFGWCRRPAQP
ncbi:hypothetical protein [Variovorax sp. Sphag1AA]|uniref:hypothetical protein n=1 Tax=Variovorax sp. Sphag1AA TaxID=2587027 RepID=UPI001620C29A|nr:hypothetical protein [Variovorax sp. Sphag1AA]MBB3177291.1 hypothetical protein [Variovorax sp. Sphag1AA]